MERTFNTISTNCSTNTYIRSQMRAKGVQDVDQPLVVPEYSHSCTQEVEALYLLPSNILAVCDPVPAVREWRWIPHFCRLHIGITSLLKRPPWSCSFVNFNCCTAILE